MVGTLIFKSYATTENFFKQKGKSYVTFAEIMCCKYENPIIFKMKNC